MPKLPSKLKLEKLPTKLGLDGRYLILNLQTKRTSKVIVSEGHWSIASLFSWHSLSSIKVAYQVLEFEADDA